MRTLLLAALLPIATASCSDSSTPGDDTPADTGSIATDTATASDTSTPPADSSPDDTSAPSDAAPSDAASSKMSFFITSRGLDGGKLGGLAGADAHCAALAAAVGAGGKTWRAYLSLPSNGGVMTVHAKDRIGTGPWFNANGVQIAANVAELHGMNNLTKATALTEKGTVVNGRGDTPNQHDILTGSKADGTASTVDPDTSCRGWTSNTTGSAIVGHHDRVGGGAAPTSWNSAHASSGCSPANLISTGGNGYFYCFATD